MWPNPQEAFTEEILNGKLHFLCCGIGKYKRLLLESTSGITKCDILFLQNASGITKLLQNGRNNTD